MIHKTRYARSPIFLIVVAAAVGGCSSDGGTTDPGEIDLTPTSYKAAELKLLIHGSFPSVRTLLDLDASGRVDQKDMTELRECVKSSDAATRPECDLVNDGKLDGRDVRFLVILLGRVTPMAQDSLAGMADALDDWVDLGETPDLTTITLDYNRDGKTDAADVKLFDGVLRDDPVSKFDFDDSGAISWRDVVIALDAVEGLGKDGDLSAFDATGDGVTDDLDLQMIGELALFTSHTRVGLLDHNADGVIDLADWGTVINPSVQPNLYNLVMPESEAKRAFESDPPTTAILRADGHSQYVYPVDLSTEMKLVVVPSNLYLKEVSSLPAGYDPLGQPPADATLYTVGLDPTAMGVSVISIPYETGDLGVASPKPQIRVGGGGLPANAVLATPDGYSKMTPADDTKYAIAGAEPTGTIPFEVNITENVISKDDKPDAKSFNKALDAALANYETFINDCPCVLDVETRANVLRQLIVMSNCIKGVLSGLKAAQASAERNHGKIAREHQMLSRISAAKWQHFSETIRTAEIMDLLLLILDTVEEFATGGYGSALMNLTGELISEIQNDLQEKKPIWEDKGPDNIMEGLLKGAAVAEVKGHLAGKAMKQSIDDLFAKGGKRLSVKKFAELAFEGFHKRYGEPSIDPSNVLKGMLKNFIKMLPGLYLDYIRTLTMNANETSEHAAKHYLESTYIVGNWKNAVKTLLGANARIDDMFNRVNNAFKEDGCALTISSTDPCLPGLRASTQIAEDNLSKALDDAHLDAAEAVSDLSAGDAAYDCYEGSESLNQFNARIEQAEAAELVAENVGKISADQAMAELKFQKAHTAKKQKEAEVEFESKCVGSIFLGKASSETAWTKLRAAFDAKQKAIDDHRAAMRAALKAYVACAADGGGGCAGSMTGDVQTKPWVAALGCLKCAPSVTVDCGGSGTVLDEAGYDPDQVQYLMGSQLPDPVDDHVYSDSSKTCGDPGADVDISYDLVIKGLMTDAQVDAAFNNSAFECGQTSKGFTTACPPNVLPMPAGDVVTVVVDFASALPSAGAAPAFTRQYIYSVVFDSDNDPGNNFTFVEPYDWDYFQDTDRWYQLKWNPSSSKWSIEVSDWTGTATPATSAVRAVIDDAQLVWFIPASEFSVPDPSYRVTAFRHDGTWKADVSAGDVNGANPTEPMLKVPTTSVVVGQKP